MLDARDQIVNQTLPLLSQAENLCHIQTSKLTIKYSIISTLMGRCGWYGNTGEASLKKTLERQVELTLEKHSNEDI